MRAMLLTVVMLAGSVAVAQQPEKEELPKPLPEAVVKAWKDAGARVGWMKVNAIRDTALLVMPEAGTVPAFQLREWKDGVVAKLPASEVTFGLDLSGARITDAGLKELAPFKNLTTLSLSRTNVADAGLKELVPLKQLTDLDLSQTKVTDAGLKELAQFNTLTSLNLSVTQVTAAGLKELAPLTNLTTLVLTETRLTDTALKALREIGLLHALTQAKTAAGGNKRPTKPEQVAHLNLHGTSITDAGLKELTPLTNLTSLQLGSKVTDAGLGQLSQLKALTYLDLIHTKATKEGVAELKKALPKCEVHPR